MSCTNYSKWDHIEISDDEDDTHPNVDTPSLFKWRHEARIEREKTEQAEKSKRLLEAETRKKEMDKIASAAKQTKDSTLEEQLSTLAMQQAEFERKEAELARQEREHPHWNVDNISHPKQERTLINKAVSKPESTNENDEESMSKFWEKNKKDMQAYGLLSKSEESMKFLLEHPHLVNDHMANYLAIWSIDLCVEEKESLMKRVAHQCITMQYILELAKSLKQDPRQCVPAFFKRFDAAEKQYKEAFVDEYNAFLVRVHERAQARLDKAKEEAAAAEAAERQARLGPGGLDPFEVLESLPAKIQEAFQSQNTPLLQQAFAELPPEEAKYHFKRVIDSGLWVPAKQDQNASEEQAGDGEEADEEEEGEEEFKDAKSE